MSVSKERVQEIANGGNAVGSIYANGEVVLHPEERRRPKFRRTPRGGAYVFFNQGVLGQMARKLSPGQMCICFTILEDYRIGEEYARGTRAQVSQKAEISRQAGYRIFRELIETKTIFEVGSNLWMLNPHLGWRGYKEEWFASRNEFPKPSWMSV